MQLTVEEVDRITLIYDDGSTQKVYGGRVRRGPQEEVVLIRARHVPREHIGMDVVAAHDDGTVEASFSVTDMWMEDGVRVYAP